MGAVEPIYFYDRLSGKVEEEKVYGGFFLNCLYKGSWIMAALRNLIAHVPFFSRFYGAIQKAPLSKRKVVPFIEAFNVDSSEFADAVESYSSFNDFFIRSLKENVRPITQEPGALCMPADARYLAYPNLYECDGIWVKGKTFSLERLLGDSELARRYEWGSIAIARLAPVDYHRFHFPCDCTPGEPREIKGPLFSVNPIALKRKIEYLVENKRVITLLETEEHGQVAYIEVGATHVGSIHQTFTPGKPYKKGEEKGYFSFGGSCVILLFEPGKVIFSQDLIEHSEQRLETRALVGQLMAVKG